MKLKKFSEYNYIKENILDDDEDGENERNWEVIIDGKGGSFWEYKYDAIESIVEILDTYSDEPLDGNYEDEEGNEMSTSDIIYMLDDMDEEEFYEKLEALKEFVDYEGDIRLINRNDDTEIEFLE